MGQSLDMQAGLFTHVCEENYRREGKMRRGPARKRYLCFWPGPHKYKDILEFPSVIRKTFHDVVPCIPHSRQALTRLTLSAPCCFTKFPWTCLPFAVHSPGGILSISRLNSKVSSSMKLFLVSLLSCLIISHLVFRASNALHKCLPQYFWHFILPYFCLFPSCRLDPPWGQRLGLIFFCNPISVMEYLMHNTYSMIFERMHE